MYLIDTNVFLEIILAQEKEKVCSQFLENNIAHSNLSDFSLYSIGILLFRQNKVDVFQEFISDVLPQTPVLSLPRAKLISVVQTKKDFNFDFDDAYQYAVAKNYGLKIVTMDKDFQAVDASEVMFL